LDRRKDRHIIARHRFTRAWVQQSFLELDDLSLELTQGGSGPPIVVLHGIEKLATDPPLFDLLARRARVIAPSHPGFGRSPLPDWIDAVDDLSYLYLDLLDKLDLRGVVLIGLSIGGWIAAEMAVKSTHRLSRLVLVAPFGIKPGGRETRDVPDIFALPPDEVSRLMWHDRALAPDPLTMPDDAAEQLLKHQEAAALYLWEPYMHNPKLPRRLHRIDVPTLVLRGASDRLVSVAHVQAYCDRIPNARIETLAGAGHVPEYEQPALLADRILRFADLTPLG
jgi:pimeloyl-ACP methyl ester carboxylesterase